MAEGKINEGDGIITLEATDTFTRDRMPVDKVIFTGTAAGVFVFTLGNTSLSLSNTTGALTFVIDFKRNVNFVSLVSGPTGATVYVLLAKKL